MSNGCRNIDNASEAPCALDLFAAPSTLPGNGVMPEIAFAYHLGL